MPKKKYLLLFEVDARERHYHITEFGKIIKFVVQLFNLRLELVESGKKYSGMIIRMTICIKIVIT